MSLLRELMFSQLTVTLHKGRLNISSEHLGNAKLVGLIYRVINLLRLLCC